MTVLLAFYAVVLVSAWGLSRWLDRREARRAREARRHVAHGKAVARRLPTPINGPNLRPDVLRVPGETDEEIVGWLVDGRFQRREW